MNGWMDGEECMSLEESIDVVDECIATLNKHARDGPRMGVPGDRCAITKGEHEELVRSARYRQVCEDTTVEKQRGNKEDNEMSDVLQGGVPGYEAGAGTLGAMNNVMEAKDDLLIKTEVMQCRGEGECKAAPKVHKIEHAGHGAAHMEHTERIDGVCECIVALKKHAHDVLDEWMDGWRGMHVAGGEDRCAGFENSCHSE